MIAETKEETQARKTKFNRRILCNYAGMTLGILVIAPIATMLFDRREPIELIEGKLIPEVVQPGQTVTVVWDVIEKRTCDGEVARQVTDSSGKIHEFKREPTVYHIVGKGTRETFTKDFTIPTGVIDGPATYQTSGTRWCNTLQKYLWPIPFEGPKVKFMIVNPPKAVEPIPPRVIQEKENVLRGLKQRSKGK